MWAGMRISFRSGRSRKAMRKEEEIASNRASAAMYREEAAAYKTHYALPAVK